MPSSEYKDEPAVNPLAPVEQFIHWLTTTTIHLAIGLAIGLIAATVMRGRHLRWTWAAGALVLVVLARRILGSGALTLGTAALCATVRGRRWHREDVETGADLADVAAGRNGPLDALRSLARKAEVRWSATGSESLVARRSADGRSRARWSGRHDPARRSDRRYAHARGRRHPLGQDGHDDLDRRRVRSSTAWARS